MVRKDMLRSDGHRIRRKRQIIRDFAREGREGKISLLEILEITEPLVREYEGREVVLADRGYFWLQLGLQGDTAWYTVMFDPEGELVQIYVDVTAGNDCERENPVFDDLYLDFVVHGERVYELDRDELEAAYASGEISGALYETALAAGERLGKLLREQREQIQTFFREQFRQLKAEWDEKSE